MSPDIKYFHQDMHEASDLFVLARLLVRPIFLGVLRLNVLLLAGVEWSGLVHLDLLGLLRPMLLVLAGVFPTILDTYQDLVHNTHLETEL